MKLHLVLLFCVAMPLPFPKLVLAAYPNESFYTCEQPDGDTDGDECLAMHRKNFGRPSCGLDVGNPINIGTGNKYQHEVDYQGGGDFPLKFERYYNSGANMVSKAFGAGSGWKHNYERSIDRTYYVNVRMLSRPDGIGYQYINLSGSWFHYDSNINWFFYGNERQPIGGVPGVAKYMAYYWEIDFNDGRIEYYDNDSNYVGRLIAIQYPGNALHILKYDANNLLSTVTHSSGRSLTFSYDGAKRLSTVTDPAGNVIKYTYNAITGDLETITYPDETPGDLTDNPTKTYVYNEPANTSGANLPHVLTGIVDENRKRFATWQYDAQRRAISSQHAGGVDYVGVTYIGSTGTLITDPATGTVITDNVNTPASSIVTDALGNQRTQRLYVVQGEVKSAGSDQPAGSGCGAATNNVTYNTDGNIVSQIDFNNHKTCYAYPTRSTSSGSFFRPLIDGIHNTKPPEIQRIEGLPASADCAVVLAGGSLPPPARQITTQWHSNLQLPIQIAEPHKITSIGRNNMSGSILTLKEQATTDPDGRAGLTPTLIGNPRIWTFTYNSLGQILSIDGPRTDVIDKTIFGYTTDGHSDLATITNPLGHVKSFGNYDANGRFRTISYPNGTISNLDYAPRGQLKTLTITGGNQVETTRFTYTPSGQIKTVTAPDSSILTYGYDDAQRLTSINDNLGNQVTYTLDKLGNRKNEAYTDIGGVLQRNIDRIYDALNRLQNVTGASQ